MVLTAYNSVFGTSGIPDGFEFVVAIDWFLDRLQTVVNVSGDTIVAASIAHMVSLDEQEALEVQGVKDPDSTTTKNNQMEEGSEEDIDA